METHREREFELPVGYVDADGRVHRTALLRKMTGREEALLAEKRNRNSGARMISELLGNCIVRLGSLDRPGVKVAQDLYSADRHYLLVKLRELTFGPELLATYSCPTCHAASSLTEDLASLEVLKLAEGELPEDTVVRLEDGYEDGERVHDTMVFRAPTGVDEEKIAPAVRENPSYGKNALMARCLKAVGDMPKPRVEALGTAIFSDLTLKDRALIDKAMNNGGPGIKMQREIVCDGCGRQFTTGLDFSNFLSPS